MGEIEAVELVEKWVFQDLSASTFSDDERKRVLDDLDELEENLVVWERPLTKCVKILNTQSGETIYRRREGHLRSFLIREGTTLYCIGVGKRGTTYDRDLDDVVERAEERRKD